MKTRHFLAYVLIAAVIVIAGCKGTEQQNQSTVSVFGTGTVSVQPDIVQMSITLSNTAPTTKAAQEEVSKMVRRAMAVLKEANVEDKNINTASLTFNSEYEYYSNRRTLVGQRAQQSINFSIEGITGDTEKVSAIIDQLIQINGIELNQVNYSVKNTGEYYVTSRELAYKKAVEKATQYAELSNLKIKKVLSITDQGTQQVLPLSNRRMMNQAMYFEADMAARSDASTELPIGNLEITTNISVVFQLK